MSLGAMAKEAERASNGFGNLGDALERVHESMTAYKLVEGIDGGDSENGETQTQEA